MHFDVNAILKGGHISRCETTFPQKKEKNLSQANQLTVINFWAADDIKKNLQMVSCFLYGLRQRAA